MGPDFKVGDGGLVGVELLYAAHAAPQTIFFPYFYRHFSLFILTLQNPSVCCTVILQRKVLPPCLYFFVT